MKVFLALACLVVSLGSLRAQTNYFTAGWLFLDSYSASQAWSSNYTGVGWSQLKAPVFATRGSGLGDVPHFDGRFRTWGFSTPIYPSFEQAIANNVYIEFTLTPADGYVMQMGYLYLSASVFSGPVSVGLFSSASGFETQHQLGETFVISSTNSSAPNSIQFNNTGDEFHSSSVTYRLYFYTAHTNRFYLGNSSSTGWTTNDLAMTVIGFSAPVVPEPSAFGALCGVGAFWLSTVAFTVSRKRRRSGLGR